jgi:hypothetical protein
MDNGRYHLATPHSLSCLYEYKSDENIADTIGKTTVGVAIAPGYLIHTTTATSHHHQQ